MTSDLFTLGGYHACFTGDCDHVSGEGCMNTLRGYVDELCRGGAEQQAEVVRLRATYLKVTATLADCLRERDEARDLARQFLLKGGPFLATEYVAFGNKYPWLEVFAEEVSDDE